MKRVRIAAKVVTRKLKTLPFEQRMAAGIFAGMAVFPPLAHLLGGTYLVLIGQRVLIFAIAALSLELLIGVAGLVSFGHAAFLGVGAYATGILASHGLGTLSLALPAALAASALFALLTGAIAVRTQGVYFIMISLAFGQMAFFVATSLAPYGGDDGLTLPSRTLVFGARWLKNEAVLFYAALACLIATYVMVRRLVGSRFGRVLRGLTQDELRLQAIGFAPYAYRLTAYVIAGAVCGLAGFLLANQAEFVSPAYMHWQRSGELIIMVLLGGTGTLYGPVLGALAFLLLEETLSRLTEHWKVILGPLLVLTVLFAKGGIAGAIERWRRVGIHPGVARMASWRVMWQVTWGVVSGRRPLWRGWLTGLRGGTDAARRSLARLAARSLARWRSGNMRVGRALVASVLWIERSVTGAAARWRRR
jgi:branched-chain amino acid transport system permease protein